MLKKILDNRQDLQELLFIKGFLITNSDISNNQNNFPFYGNWQVEKIGAFNFWSQKSQSFFFIQKDEITFFLGGHAYNPFTMEHDENRILEKIAESYSKNKNLYLDSIDELTGLFVLGYIKDDRIDYLVDPSGFQSAYYGKVNDKFFLSSHTQIIGDICSLEIDPFIEELTSYKWYKRVMGPYLPADLSSFINIKRIVPNIYYSYKNNYFDIERIYPRNTITTCETKDEYIEVIKAGADILKNNMELISKKWDKPQISLTGGIDSNTTFAAANGNYAKYETFSYVSAEKEKIDADAAEIIAKAFNIKHITYNIPENSEKLVDYNDIIKIIEHNNGYIKYVKNNELRKRVALIHNCSADIEVKSWGSETTRGYWYKHFGRKTMPKLSGKLYRNLYKIFLLNRPLAHKVDNIFDEYIRKFGYDNIPAVFPTADMFYWEVTWGSWGSSNISEMRICFDITVPYNNRKFLDLMFRVPLEKRIKDQHHLDMKKYLNEKLYDMDIRVVNMHETDFRAKMLNLIFTINQFLPF